MLFRSFGNQSTLVGDTITITVNAGPVTFGAALVTGAAFTKGADGCSGTTVAAGGTCTIVANFNGPPGNSTRNGNLSVPYSGAAGSPLQLGLTGR